MTHETTSIPDMKRAVEAYKKGKIVIIMDDKSRENEGDFAMAAEDVTSDAVNFMAKYGRGLICVPMAGEDLDRLGLRLMVDNTVPLSTAFTLSVDAAQGITTGISSADRARTIKLLSDPSSDKADFTAPGHIFPLRYQEGGVMVRAGHTEGSVDLACLAEKRPAAVICEIMNEDGTMARRPQLEEISRRHNLPIVTIADIIAQRRANESLFIKRVAETRLPTRYGEFRAFLYRSPVGPSEHIALVKGDINTEDEVLVRVHSECLTGDVFGSLRCECGEQMSLALNAIQEEGKGVFVYMRQEGRGIGLLNKFKAYALQDQQGLDTVEANEKLGFPADLRYYGVGAQILRDIGVRRFRLLTNNPKKIVGLEGFGLDMTAVVPILAPSNPENKRYIKTKRDKMGHLLASDE